MKSPFALPAFAAASLLLLSACGQPGPLYMPKPPVRGAATAPASPAVPAQTAPVPATTVSPPAPAAGMSQPPAGSNSNNTQAPSPTSPVPQQ
ncbi:lipoprotein [Massilia sp. WF1]|uniref:LPS translocon maturation chaperone LptM n=1 Tax=Massilia sp. WF1 TaxID=1406431 RepID=UPI0018D21258|nr:lipoprotein [Massilia sp. WF1]